MRRDSDVDSTVKQEHEAFCEEHVVAFVGNGNEPAYRPREA